MNYFKTYQQFFHLFALGLLLSFCAEHKFHEVPVPQKETAPKPELSVLQPISAARPILKKSDKLVGTYAASLLKDETLHFALDTIEMSTSFPLVDIHQTLSEQRSQLSRNFITDSFKQGHPEMVVHEQFNQEARKGLVDILVVIDNSISMTEEQNNLSDKMNELLASLGQSDWQIGIITTTAIRSNGVPQCAMSLVKSNEADAAARFKKAVLAGTSGDRNEEGFLQAVVGLGCSSAPWLRPSSTLAVLIVSDEDNCSDGSGCAGAASENENYLIDYVENDLGREVGKNAGFYGIFSPPSAPCNTSSNIGVRYQRLVDYKANGAMNYGNICDASYKSTLNRISDNIATLLSSQFELESLPLANSLELKLRLSDGSEIAVPPAHYSLNGKIINFLAGQEPPAGAMLLATYRISGVHEFSSVNLREVPAAETLQVQVDEHALALDAFTLQGRTLSFVRQPHPLASIQVKYRENKPLTQRFAINQKPLPDSLIVKVDGRVTREYSYQPDSNEIHFNEPPQDGAQLSLEYRYREGPQLDYQLPLAQGSSQYQLLDGSSPVAFTENQGTFSIPEAVHKLGKTLTLAYQMPDAATKKIPLAHQAIDAWLESQSSACELEAGIKIDGDILVVNCGVTERTDFTLAYTYLEPQRSFQLPGIPNPETGGWQVFEDGKAIVDFTRSGSSIHLEYEPKDQAMITVQYTFPE